MGRSVQRGGNDGRETPGHVVFGESSLNFQLVVYTNDFSMTFETKDAINTRISRRFAEEGILIPYPQREIHIKK